MMHRDYSRHHLILIFRYVKLVYSHSKVFLNLSLSKSVKSPLIHEKYYINGGFHKVKKRLAETIRTFL